MVARFAVSTALVLACSACAITSKTKEVLSGSVIAQPQNRHCFGQGGDTVLVFSKMKHMPWVPFAYSGWRLTLSVPGTFEAGTTLVAPGDAVASLWSISHHPSAPAHDVAGSVAVLSTSKGRVTVRLNLASPSTGWRLDGTFRFKPASYHTSCGA
jgi:hypothetical protein